MRQFIKTIFVTIPILLLLIQCIFNIKTVRAQNRIPFDNWPSNDETEFSESEWLVVLKELANSEAFALHLTDSQAQILESVYQKLFKDNLIISIEDNQAILEKISGLALAADLESLLAGKQVEIRVDINNLLSEADNELIEEYIDNNLLHEYLFYRFDVRAIQIIDGKEVPLNIDRPITMRQKIPYQLQYRGLLKALIVHNGNLSELPLAIEADQFILSSDKLSAFAIFSATVAEEGEDPVVGVVGTRMPDFIWWLGGLVILMLAFGVFMAFKKKAS